MSLQSPHLSRSGDGHGYPRVHLHSSGSGYSRGMWIEQKRELDLQTMI